MRVVLLASLACGSRYARALVQPFIATACALWVLASVGACGEEVEPVITSPGSGPANERPLWVPRPGPIGPGHIADMAPVFAMSEDRWVGGRRVFTAGYQFPTEFFETGIGPSEPYFARFYGRHDDGIYLEGDTREGLYDPPILFVPSTVRVGMRWSYPPRWTFEVTARTETPDGILWTLVVIDALRRTTDDANNHVLKGVPQEFEFLEGSAAGPYVAFRSAPSVLTQDEVPPPQAPVDVPTLTLRPLNGGEPIVSGLLPGSFGVTVDPDGERIDLVIDGRGTSLENSGVTAAFFVGGDVTACGRYSVALDQVSTPPQGEGCRDPRGSIVDGAGRVLRIPNGGWHRLPYCVPAVGTNGQPTCNNESLSMAGIFRAADGTAMVFRDAFHDGTIQVAPHDGVEDEAMGEQGAMRPAGWPWQALERGDVDFAVGGQALWLAEPENDGWTLLVVKRDGLTTLRVAADGHVDHSASFVDEGGILGLTVDASGRHLLRAHPDGHIERILWDADGVQVQPLASVPVEKGRVLAGAVEVGSRLFVLTLHGYAGTDPQYDIRGRYGDELDLGADRAVKPELGHLQLWEAPLPPNPPQPRTPPPITHFAFGLDGRGVDAVMCGAPPDPPLAGWTVGGVRAIAYRNDTNGCTVIVPDKSVPRDPTSTAGVLRGDVPELGAFSLAISTAWDEAFVGDDMYVGAALLADRTGFAACRQHDVEPSACTEWRTFDRDWKLVSEHVTTAPVFAELPDLSTCTTDAGATCATFGLPLLDCRGPGAPGAVTLETLAPYTGVGPSPGPSAWVIDACFPVGDTLWLELHERSVRGEFRMFMKVDTVDWTFERVPVDAAVYNTSARVPEGDDVLFFDDFSAMLTLHEDEVERFNLYFGKADGVTVRGPLLFGADPVEFPAATRRVWRPDLFGERLAHCGDGVLEQDEFCPEDRTCEQVEQVCLPDGTTRKTCNGRGDFAGEFDCTTLCEGGACWTAPLLCVAGACVLAPECGTGVCAFGESCFAGGDAPHCAALQRCGDGVCESEEVGSDCVDCVPLSWDHHCSWLERWGSDCARCGDGLCHEGELAACPEDCVGCGDEVCAVGERDRCPSDCPGCGNGICELQHPYLEGPGSEGDCPLDCLPCEADRAGCFAEGIITCDGAGAVIDYVPCGDAAICVAGACVEAKRCGNGRCEPGEVDGCPVDCH